MIWVGTSPKFASYSGLRGALSSRIPIVLSPLTEGELVPQDGVVRVTTTNGTVCDIRVVAGKAAECWRV